MPGWIIIIIRYLNVTKTMAPKEVLWWNIIMAFPPGLHSPQTEPVGSSKRIGKRIPGNLQLFRNFAYGKPSAVSKDSQYRINIFIIIIRYLNVTKTMAPKEVLWWNMNWPVRICFRTLNTVILINPLSLCRNIIIMAFPPGLHSPQTEPVGSSWNSGICWIRNWKNAAKHRRIRITNIFILYWESLLTAEGFPNVL